MVDSLMRTGQTNVQVKILKERDVASRLKPKEDAFGRALLAPFIIIIFSTPNLKAETHHLTDVVSSN